jgi:hypothetical protein
VKKPLVERAGPSWKKISGDVLIDIPQIGATVAEQINEDSTVESLIS